MGEGSEAAKARPSIDPVTAALESALTTSRNPDGGWAYTKGKASRVEPTAWVALGPIRVAAGALEWLAGAERVDGWYADDRDAPINYGFNGLVLLALLASGQTSRAAERLTRRLIDVKGLALSQSPGVRQDNSLQAWSWVAETFSWVEPTAYCLLALKRAVRCGAVHRPEVAQRIDEAERLLLDRVCAGGGWNYGNANVLGKDLRPYAPTTALALLALQDRRDAPAVTTSLQFLAAQSDTERSGLALALTAVCLRVLGLDAGSALFAAREQCGRSLTLGNAVTLAALRLALADDPNAFQPFVV